MTPARAWLTFSILLGSVFASVLGEAAPEFGGMTNGPALAYEEPRYLTGSIYAEGPEPRRLRYRFTRTATRNGSTLDVLRAFTYPDGRLAARERVRYEGDSLVSYELDESQIGMTGSARIVREPANARASKIEFTYGSTNSNHRKLRTEALSNPTLIADMVGVFLPAHWDEFQKGGKLKCRYIVVSRRETVGFTFSKIESTGREQAGTITIKMEPSSPLISALVQPLFFTLETPTPHRVLSYTGRTTPKLQAGNKWQDLDAVTVFDWQSAR